MARPPRPAAPTDPRERRLGNLRIVWTRALRYPGHIAAALAALCVSSAATLGIPYGLKRVIDRGFSSGVDPHGVTTSFHYLLMIVATLALATAIRFWFVAWMGERVVADLRIAVQANLLTLSPRFFEENRPSEIASRLTSDTTLIEQVVGTTVSVALRSSFTMVGGLIFLFTLSVKLAALMVIGMPLVLLPILLLGRRLRGFSRHSQDRIADVGALATETLGAMRIVQAFGQEGREAARFRGAVEAVFGTARRRIALRAVMTALVIGLMFGAIVLILWQGALDVAHGRMTGGAITAFVATCGIVAGSFGSLAEVYGDLLRGAGAASRLSELLGAEADIRAPAHPVALPASGAGRLQFDHVHLPLPDPPRDRRARRRHARHRSRPDRRSGRPVGGGQVDASAARAALLRSAGRARAARRRGTGRRRSRARPQADRDGAAGHGDLRGLGARQSALRRLGCRRLGAVGRRRGRQRRDIFCTRCPMDSTPISAKAVPGCRAASASASRSRAHCSATHRCCCSTRRPRRSTPRASASSRTRSIA